VEGLFSLAIKVQELFQKIALPPSELHDHPLAEKTKKTDKSIE
jgi:hypothetical protein